MDYSLSPLSSISQDCLIPFKEVEDSSETQHERAKEHAHTSENPEEAQDTPE